ncbi:S8 family serine peptidase [Xanthomonadaceae bacterium JHOS43]|nr:S8 family serine peptidase [Xanthomonadaceae bacterium JHOS43]MCX7563401.1 S8 family serine peptidase [Xanthomonadaceae bacterium XH05]
MLSSVPFFRLSRGLLGCVLLLTNLGSGRAHAADEISPETRAALADRVLFNAGRTGEAFDSYIVYYRDDAAPGDEKSAAATRTRSKIDADLSRTSKAVGFGARHERRLATGGHLIRLDTGKKLTGAASDLFMAELAVNPDIVAIEPNALQTIRLIPNDPHFQRLQWGLNGAQGGINAPTAWDLATGNGVVIAIVDTGSTPHPDLNNQTIAGYDFITDPERSRDGGGRDADPNDEGDWFEEGDCPSSADERRNSSWHGTHVAGIAAAQANNGIGVAGTAFGAKVQHVRALGRCGGSVVDIAEAIIWASGGNVAGVPANTTPAKVINLSLGGEGACGLTYQNAINQARNRGSVVIVSAGNENMPAADSRPANCTGVVTVAANNKTGGRASYSNFGPAVDVAAPGGDCEGACRDDPSGMILSTLNDGTTTQGTTPGYYYSNGTSMAAPFVSGVAALMFSKKPSLTPTQVENHLRDTARPFPGMCADGCGTGIVDAAAAVRAAESGTISQYPISIARTGNGPGTITSSPAGINCGSSCAARFNANATVTLTASSASGSRFVGWSGACSGSSTTCTLTANRAHAAQARFDVPVTRLSSPSVLNDVSSSGGALMYSLTVPTGSTALLFRISGGSGDADLYVRRGAQPTTTDYDCRPYRVGNSETCQFSATMSGTWYAMLVGDPSFSGVKLEARYASGPSGGRTLSNNVPIEAISAQKGGARYYKIQVPASASRLRIQTQGDNGDLDLYVRRGGTGGGVPQLGLFDWVSGWWDSNEYIRLDEPTPAMYYVMLHAYEAFEEVRLLARYTNATIRYTGLGAGSVRLKRSAGSEEAPRCTAFPCESSLKNASYDLIATPSTGSRFAGWTPSQCDSIVNGNCRIRPNTRARDVTVNFTRNSADSPTLTVSKSGNGDGTVRIRRVSTGTDYGVCESFPCRAGPPNAIHELIAEPRPGSRFTNWNAAQCDSIVAGKCRIQINRPVQVTATFQPE